MHTNPAAAISTEEAMACMAKVDAVEEDRYVAFFSLAPNPVILFLWTLIGVLVPPGGLASANLSSKPGLSLNYMCSGTNAL